MVSALKLKNKNMSVLELRARKKARVIYERYRKVEYVTGSLVDHSPNGSLALCRKVRLRDVPHKKKRK